MSTSGGSPPRDRQGSQASSVPFGAKTGVALDRYLRLRLRHSQADSPALGLGPKGGLTDSGIAQMLERRCLQARHREGPFRINCGTPRLMSGWPRVGEKVTPCACSVGGLARC